MQADKPILTKKFLSQFKSEQDFTQFFTDLYKQALKGTLGGELDEHLGYGCYERKSVSDGYYRNGKADKQLKPTYVKLDLQVPRDREGSFEPQLVKKRQTALAKAEDTVLSLYNKGMSTCRSFMICCSISADQGIIWDRTIKRHCLTHYFPHC